MPLRKRAGRARRDSPQPSLRRGATSTAANGNAESNAALVLRPETLRFWCPECGVRALDFTHKPHRDGGWTVLIHCFGCRGGLHDIHAATGIAKWRLLTWPPPDELGPSEWWVGRREGPGDSPPSEASVAGWRSALVSTPDAMRYLTQRRRLTLETIDRYELGYDRGQDAITFPVRDANGELVNLKRRSLDPAADPKTKGLARPACWYPDVPQSGAVLLVAGEIDALTGRQLELPAVTTTCGELPEHLAPELAGRAVYVMYDVGEDLAAERTARRLRALGSRAVVVRLSRLGLTHKSDLNDLYCQGGTRRDIERLIKRERRAA
jgi:hypothetical protein